VPGHQCYAGSFVVVVVVDDDDDDGVWEEVVSY
jgi:hypothetical protein